MDRARLFTLIRRLALLALLLGFAAVPAAMAFQGPSGPASSGFFGC